MTSAEVARVFAIGFCTVADPTAFWFS